MAVASFAHPGLGGNDIERQNGKDVIRIHHPKQTFPFPYLLITESVGRKKGL